MITWWKCFYLFFFSLFFGFFYLSIYFAREEELFFFLGFGGDIQNKCYFWWSYFFTNLIFHPTRRQLYGHLPPITKTIQVRRARHAGHCWRSKDELVSDVLLWTPTYGQAKAGRPARTYIQQLCEDTGCNPEDLPEAMNDREKCREMVKDIRAGDTTWWWWWWWWWWFSYHFFRTLPIYIYIYIYVCVCVCVCVCHPIS